MIDYTSITSLLPAWMSNCWVNLGNEWACPTWIDAFVVMFWVLAIFFMGWIFIKCSKANHSQQKTHKGVSQKLQLTAN